MLVKAILKANLQFGTARSYEQALKTFHHKVEQLYKGEVCFKAEDVFYEDTFSLNIPSTVVTMLEKTIKNTAYLLEALAPFALAGKTYCWILGSGKATFSLLAEPMEKKTIVQHFLVGRQLAKEPGHENAAIEELSLAISKFERHWTALERRGYVHGLVGNFDAAIQDFNTSLEIYPNQAYAYFSRARVNMMQNNFESSVTDFDLAWKNANPQMPIYWSARRMKADSCIRLGKFTDAVQELKFFTNQNFIEGNPNYAWRKSAWLNYSYVLSKTKADIAATDAFLKAYNIEDSIEPVIEGDLLAYYESMCQKCNLRFVEEESSNVVNV